MIRTCDLNAATRRSGRALQTMGMGSTTGYDSTPVRPDCQTLGAALEANQVLEDQHAAALAFHWRRWCELRATRRQLETLAGGGV